MDCSTSLLSFPASSFQISTFVTTILRPFKNLVFKCITLAKRRRSLYSTYSNTDVRAYARAALPTFSTAFSGKRQILSFPTTTYPATDIVEKLQTCVVVEYEQITFSPPPTIGFLMHYSVNVLPLVNTKNFGETVNSKLEVMIGRLSQTLKVGQTLIPCTNLFDLVVMRSTIGHGHWAPANS